MDLVLVLLVKRKGKWHHWSPFCLPGSEGDPGGGGESPSHLSQLLSYLLVSQRQNSVLGFFLFLSKLLQGLNAARMGLELNGLLQEIKEKESLILV